MNRHQLLLSLALLGCESASSIEPEQKGLASQAPMLGPKDAKVTLVVFTDYQCSFCQKLESTLDRLLAAYPSDVRLQIVNYPLAQHTDAPLAALAARAAGKQGRFWEMHRRMMASEGALDRTALKSQAAALGLDLVAFERDLDSPEACQVLEGETALAKKLEIRGTPTLFINGRRVTGVRPYAELDKLVSEELALANGAKIQVTDADEADEGEVSCGHSADCNCDQQ